MMKAISSQKVRARIGEYIDRANLTGDAFLLMRDGKAKAVLVGAKQYLKLLELSDAARVETPAPARNDDSDARPVSLQEVKKLIS